MTPSPLASTGRRPPRILAAWAFLLLSAGACGGSAPPAPEPSTSPSPAVASASPAVSPAPAQPMLEKSTLQSRGKNPWRLDAERIQYDDSRRTARVGKLTWTLQDGHGKDLVRVEGNGARVDVEAEKVSFEGPVMAYGPRGEVLDVTNLLWDGKARRFLGKEGVRLLRDGTVLTGLRLDASPDLKQIEVEGKVRVVLKDVPAPGASPR